MPVIVSNVGALPDLVPDTLGKVCEPDADSIAQAMQSMLTFDTANFESAIKVEKQKLSWEKLTSTFLEVGNSIKFKND